MILCNVSGGAFELQTGRAWTHGFSLFRDRETFKIEHRDGRWHFEINGVEYSAKKIAPRIEGIQTYRKY